jgi:transposase InsO family protein
MLRWAAVRRQDRAGLDDRVSGPVPGDAPHGLLGWEKDRIVEVALAWSRVDLTHRKLAHRGSRLGLVFVSESSFYRVLVERGYRLPDQPRPDKRRKKPLPDWAELVPGVVYIYDFTHFSGLPSWCSIAVVDVVSRYCLALLLSPEETSLQVEQAFTAALIADGKEGLLGDRDFAAELALGRIPDDDGDRFPVVLAMSDNGPQMTSTRTSQFMAMARIGQHFGRPGTPNDQAWIESFFGHLKTERPHLDKITDPAELRRELEAWQIHYNQVRLHEGIGYVTPEDEHFGRGEAIRQARLDGLEQARLNRFRAHRDSGQNCPAGS